MSERLPLNVICCSCGKEVPAHNARRKIELWARIGKGGSLSGIKDQHAKNAYRCDTCVREGKFPDQSTEQEAMFQ